ncbi:hypothetical protein [Lapillicoccus sp.]|uniref:hypothetical protein n=1 Tax=Lapillicoccus sp. TaxID=1909287 RepID=UPI0025F37499|nr:hypothetical protein [Lapillicoccus sp.]
MGIGLGVFLIVVGAVCSFTTLDTQYLHNNLDTLGYILIVGGVLALVFGTIQNYQRANPKVLNNNRVERRTRIEQDPTDPGLDRRIVEERRTEDL